MVEWCVEDDSELPNSQTKMGWFEVQNRSQKNVASDPDISGLNI